MSPSFSLHAQTGVRGVLGERRYPPYDDQWGEEEHCLNTALFDQMLASYSAMSIENASRVHLNGR